MIREKNFYKTLFRLALPSAFQSFLSLLVVMADNIMISRFDPENALAAVSQVNSVSTFVISMLMGIGAGGIVLISQYWGKRDKTAIKPICGMVCLFSMLLSLLVITLVLTMPRAVLKLVLDPKETVLTDIAVRYFRIVVEQGNPITPTEMEHIDSCYESYHENGGNGTGTIMYEKIKEYLRLITTATTEGGNANG